MVRKPCSPDDQKAFTLIELLLVISIIGLLSTVTMQGLSSAREKARIAKLLELDQSIKQSIGDEMFGEWLFEDGGIDASGWNNNGSAQGLVTFTTGIGNGQAVHIERPGYIYSANSRQLNFGYQDSYTITFWFKTTNNWGGPIASRKFLDGQLSYPWIIYGPDINNHVTFQVRGMGEFNAGLYSQAQTSGYNYADGKWHFGIAVRDYDERVLKLYIDGVLQAEIADQTVSTLSDSAAFAVGDDAVAGGPTAGSYIGDIDNLRIYHKAARLGSE